MIFNFYTVAVLAAIFVPLLPRAEVLDGYRDSWWPGFYYVLACYLAFTAAYMLRRSATRLAKPLLNRAKEISSEVTAKNLHAFPEVSTWYLGFLAVWSLIGAGITLLQVQMTLGLGVYLSLISQGAKAVEAARGATILVDSTQGGLPGFIKVWNQNCTTSALLLLFLLAAGIKIRGFWPIVCTALIAGSYVLRNFISMDRLALLALVPAAYYLWNVSSWRVRKVVLLVGALVFCLAQIQSMRRDSQNGALGFFILYVQSGMINANLMISSLQGGHTYGFASVLSALYWFLKALRLNVLNPDIQYTWLWNDAHNSYGLLFLDFGWLGPVLMLWGGAMAQRMDRLSLFRGLPSDWKVKARIRMRAFLAYAALSSMFVPAYLGPEFTITLFSLGLAAWVETRYPRFCFKAGRKQLPGRFSLVPGRVHLGLAGRSVA